VQLQHMLFVSGVMPHDDELIGAAVGLARTLGARLSALAVLRPKAQSDEVTGYLTRLQQRATEAGQSGPLPALVEQEPRHGDAVARAVTEGGFDCVLAAMPARRQLGAAIATQGFAPLLRATPVPLVALPPRYAPPPSIAHVLLPVDFSAASERALDHTIELCQLLGASLDLVYVFDVENPAEATAERAAATSPRALIQIDQRRMAELTERAQAAGVAATGTFHEGVTHTAVLDYASEHRPDLVVLSHRGPRRMADIFSGTITDRIVSRLTCPAVIVRG